MSFEPCLNLVGIGREGIASIFVNLERRLCVFDGLRRSLSVADFGESLGELEADHRTLRGVFVEGRRAGKGSSQSLFGGLKLATCPLDLAERGVGMGEVGALGGFFFEGVDGEADLGEGLVVVLAGEQRAREVGADDRDFCGLLTQALDSAGEGLVVALDGLVEFASEGQRITEIGELHDPPTLVVSGAFDSGTSVFEGLVAAA